MKYQKIAVILFLTLLTDVFSDINEKNKKKNKNFILISGYPQSGTTLIASIIGSFNYVTTMFNKCLLKYGEKRCESFNYEGQWMLDLESNNVDNNEVNDLTNKDIIKEYGPGKICVKDRSSSSSSNTKVKTYIRNSWDYYWNSNSINNYNSSKNDFFLHKSPADMVKLPFIIDLFQQSSDRIKIIIVMKHPASINKATLNQQWIKEYNHINKKFSLLVGEKRKYHIKKNMNHFFKYLTKNKSNFNDCKEDLGWLPAHQLALNQILTITSTTHTKEKKKSNTNTNTNINAYNNVDIHLLHSEDLQYPRILCTRLVRFLLKDINPASLSNIQQSAMNNSCANIGFKEVSTINKIPVKSGNFNLNGRISSSSNINIDTSGNRFHISKQQQKQQKQQQHKHQQHKHRRLREHHYDSSISISTPASNDAKFIDKDKQAPIIMRDVLRRNKERLKDFEKALKEYRKDTSDGVDVAIEKINEIEEELQKFGYSLYEPFRVESSIMQRYGS